MKKAAIWVWIKLKFVGKWIWFAMKVVYEYVLLPIGHFFKNMYKKIFKK